MMTTPTAMEDPMTRNPPMPGRSEVDHYLWLADQDVDQINPSELTNAERIALVQARATMALAAALKIIAEPELRHSKRPRGDEAG
ncbi:hypothetical protein K1T35_48325 (plasmid) [Pseudonocardia sp. DSM 110487]|uniref:hypothetical protein n=1 Tax=Pseudonocardia sp. DSM 110487 TaxID=2865833 RepID=UPI001C6A3211|nr:hypothetical protein [Pseudonocardia sp. DSM 110487]QYN41155.1 hypothetical protein K1T35_48325 [Pseudonocardia sp. DSM 110487]